MKGGDYMSTIKDYLEISPMHQAMQNEKLWEQAFSIKELIPNYWESAELIELQQSIQLAMQPTLDAMAPLSSAINESMKGVTSLNKLHFGIQQFQDIHKLIQPMTEYLSILGDLKLTFTVRSVTDIIDLNDDDKVVDDLSKFESNIDLLPAENEVIETIVKDESYLNWFNKYANKIHDIKKEAVAKWIFFYILDRIFTKLFDFMLDKII